MLCRDCCCGTRAKHPRTDHDAQRDALEAVAERNPAVQVRVVDCLDQCDRSNVVLVRRTDLPRRQRDTWVGGVLTDRATEAVVDWVEGGAQAPPQLIRSLVFRPDKGR